LEMEWRAHRATLPIYCTKLPVGDNAEQLYTERKRQILVNIKGGNKEFVKK